MTTKLTWADRRQHLDYLAEHLSFATRTDGRVRLYFVGAKGRTVGDVADVLDVRR